LIAAESAVAATPLSVLKEPESLKDDPKAQESDLSYRVSIRPYSLNPVVMKLYVVFRKSNL
jgi:hypothetical protein